MTRNSASRSVKNADEPAVFHHHRRPDPAFFHQARGFSDGRVRRQVKTSWSSIIF